MAKYDLQIELLERLIHNWYDIKTKEDFYKVFPEYKKYRYCSPKHMDGLCSITEIQWLDMHERWEMFDNWIYCVNTVYPVGGKDEYNSLNLITDNPKRLHLAVWCLRWLRERNIEEVQEEVGEVIYHV